VKGKGMAMTLLFPSFKNHANGEQMTSGPLTQQKTRVIQLREAALSEKQANQKKNQSPSMGPDMSAPEKSGVEMVKKLFDAIVYYTNQNNFSKAEQIREALIQKFPSSVREIVRSGEIIEQRKTAAINPEKIRPWADLFDQFTPSEAAAFYFALKEFVVKPNQPVFQQGSCDNRLYFVRAGQLKVKYFNYDLRKNMSLAMVRRGDIVGIETFFTLTNHTTSLVAIEEAKILYLEKSVYQQLVTHHHGIESRLFRYCESKQIQYNQKLPENPGRRAHQRYKTELAATIWRMDPNGRPEGKLGEGHIVDISAGGLGYSIKNLKIGEAACLHNSRILIVAPYHKYGLSHELRKTGTVVSLKFNPFGECSVHVQFDEPMDEDRVMEIAQHADVIAFI
jgi:CRP-like cAMP-binding protein